METKDIKDINDSKLAVSVYNDLASPAMKQIGQSAEGLLKLVALPFKFLGLTAEQLEKKYVKFIEEAVNRVPPQKLTAPQSSVVAPLLDYVKFCFADEPGNDLLQEMFSNLLSSSINQDSTGSINKSFVETMRFLSGNEAKLLQWFSDVLITRRTHDSQKSDTYFLGGFSIISAFTFYEYESENTQDGIMVPTKTIEISTSTPCSTMLFDFSATASLDILVSLGLIKFDRETYSGLALFENLLRLKNRDLLDFEIPPLFASVMACVESGKYHNIASAKTGYSELLLPDLLKSEVLQLYGILSQNQSISTEQLVHMEHSRSKIYITQYGRQFLRCCIQ